jgi:protein-L-isoaspartate(D-aspartate) O-methyltransferase
MVVHHLAARGIRDPRVLAAMGRVPRERFVPAPLRDAAYDDRALPLDAGQTISQPYMVARTCELARIGPNARVLDVGTGSGYQAAILAELAAEVVTIERIEALALAARSVLESLGYGNKVSCVVGDGSLGWAEGAPYDAIVGAAAAPRVPEAMARQLVLGGRAVMPVGGRSQQMLTVMERVAVDRWVSTPHDPCVYVPLIGAGGFID